LNEELIELRSDFELAGNIAKKYEGNAEMWKISNEAMTSLLNKIRSIQKK